MKLVIIEPLGVEKETLLNIQAYVEGNPINVMK